MTNRIIITGHRGFIGQHLVRVFKSRGLSITLFEGDVESIDDVRSNIKRSRANKLFHLAGRVPNYNSANPFTLHDHEINVRATRNVAESSQETNVHVIFPSTMGVYGPSVSNLPEGSPLNPIGMYGKSKLECEEILRKGLSTYTIFRIANAFGPGSDRGDLVTSLIHACLRSEPLTLQIDPLSERDYLYITDVVRAMIDFAIPFRTVNLGSGRGTTVSRLITLIETILHRKLHVNFDQERERSRFVLNTDEINRMGFQPQVSIEQGIAETTYWLQTHMVLNAP